MQKENNQPITTALAWSYKASYENDDSPSFGKETVFANSLHFFIVFITGGFSQQWLHRYSDF